MEECEPILLEPFVHQVGGHSHMFKYDSTTVCKPLVERECHFYQTVPECLKEFVPEFKGVVEVAFDEDSDGYYNMTILDAPAGTPAFKCKRRVFNNAGNSPGSSGGEGGKSDSDSDHSPKRSTSKKTSDGEEPLRRGDSFVAGSSQDGNKAKAKTSPGCSQNPWSHWCHKREMDKMRMTSSGMGPKKFILLENVVSQFHYPCILDLKMGTRQHGDDETEAKREKKIKRCLTTTSSTIGLRFCGMQTFQQDTGQFICKNKYYGRRLSLDGFRESLNQFLHNGIELRTDLIDQIVERLQQLYSLLSKQNTYRFYSSSLLIMYEGREKNLNKSELRKTATTTVSEKEINAKTRKSEGEWPHHSRSSERRSEQSKNQVSPERSRSREVEQKNSRRDRRHRTFDVCMVDFAHTTHQGYHNDQQRSGPDTGYLFGLENLIRMFTELKDQAS